MRVHELIDKRAEVLTEEEKKELKELVDAFVAAVDALSKEHGLGFQAVLQATPAGIIPATDIVKRVVEKEMVQEGV